MPSKSFYNKRRRLMYCDKTSVFNMLTVSIGTTVSIRYLKILNCVNRDSFSYIIVIYGLRTEGSETSTRGTRNFMVRVF